MKLQNVKISDFKCIRKACQFDVSDITCLVGKNESGKTAALEALYRLNPIIPEHGNFDVDDDYPRIDVEDYRLEVENGRREPAVVTWATFSLDENDLKEIEADLPRILARPELTLYKGYANELLVQFPIDEANLIRALIDRAKLTTQQKKALNKCATLQDVAESLKSGEKSGSSSAFLETVNAILETGLHQYLYKQYFESSIPKFLYFDEFYQMKGHVNIQSLIQRKKDNKLLDSDYPLLGIIDLARLNLEEITNPKRALERDNRLQGASNHLTQSIMKYWSQNRDLEMRFDIRPGLPDDPPGMQSGTNLWCSVYNAKQKVSTLLGRRSKGFVWFFSFLAWFSQQKRKSIPLILLLDEPSLHLHALAQRDLLHFIEDECRTGLQVIYTTQSSYLIDPNRFDRVRILEDRSTLPVDIPGSSREGTHISTDPLRVKRESTLPLQGALGHSLLQELFPAQDLLIVGNIHDLIFLETMSGLLMENGRRRLDPRWYITPMGGAIKLPVFIALLGPRAGQRVVCLFDQEVDVEVDLKSVFERNLLKKEYIFTYGGFTDNPVAAVEDLLDPEFYLYLVNSAYLEVMTKPISKSQIRKKGRKITEVIDEIMASMLQTERVHFSRFKTAKFFLEHGPALKPQISTDTLDRFENLFDVINSALP